VLRVVCAASPTPGLRTVCCLGWHERCLYTTCVFNYLSSTCLLCDSCVNCTCAVCCVPCRSHAWIEDSAMFGVARTLPVLCNQAWWDWPEGLRFRQEAAMAAFRCVQLRPKHVRKNEMQCKASALLILRACVSARKPPWLLSHGCCRLAASKKSVKNI